MYKYTHVVRCLHVKMKRLRKCMCVYVSVWLDSYSMAMWAVGLTNELAEPV